MNLKSLKRQIGAGQNYQLLLTIGQISLLGMILLSRLDLQIVLVDFVEGLLTGLSITTNLVGLALYGRSQREKGNDNG